LTNGLPKSYSDILNGIITVIAIFAVTILFSRWEKITLFEIGVVPNRKLLSIKITRDMEIKVKIIELKTVNELDFYWTNKDYLNLLKEFDYPDVEKIKENEILEYLFMAISDFEPANAAEILLKYKMSDKLNDGQIQNLSHEMLIDKVAEHYVEPAFHFDLFNINQFLRKAYNGRFPDTEATVITASFQGVNLDSEITKEILIKSLCYGLKKSNLIVRLFADQIEGTEPFDDAGKVIWDYRKSSENTMEIITSKNWIDKEDFEQMEFETDVIFFDEE